MPSVLSTTATPSDMLASAAAAAAPQHKTAPASADLNDLNDLDVAALWRRYTSRPRAPLRANTQDLTPLLCALHKLSRYAHGDLREQEGRAIAMQISRSSRLYLPADRNIRELARATLPVMMEVLKGSASEAPRPRGVQVALDEFGEHWRELLNEDLQHGRPITLVKSVPLKNAFTVSPSIVVGATLGRFHPPRSTCVASTVSADDATDNQSGHPPLRPRLSLLSVEGGLRLETRLQTGQTPDEDAACEAAMSRMEDILQVAARDHLTLEEVLFRFNRKAGREFQLQMAPDLPPGTSVAHLKVGAAAGETAAPSTELRAQHESTLWFQYRLLAEPSAIDRVVAAAGGQTRLELCRQLVDEAVREESQLLGRNRPSQAGHCRQWLVAGCAVQLCLEASQRGAFRGLRYQFEVPVAQVMSGMTVTERNLMNGVAAHLAGRLSTIGLQVTLDTDSRRPRPTFVSFDCGDPMGCVRLRVESERPEGPASRAVQAPPPADPAGPRSRTKAPSALQVVLEDDRLGEERLGDMDLSLQWRYPHGGRPTPRYFDQLQPLQDQPRWVRTLLSGKNKELYEGAPGAEADPKTLITDGPASSFATDYDTALNEVLEDIRTPGRWSGFAAELAPRFITQCAGWPLGRTLDIHNSLTGSLMSRAGEQLLQLTPVRVARMMLSDHYVAMQGSQLLDIPGDGDCFYAALLASMTPRERSALLEICGCTGPQASSLEHATAALRRHFANHLDLYRSGYREQITQLHALMQ